MPVVVFEVGPDSIFELTAAAVNTTAQLLLGEQREPALDQVEPGAACRSEVQVEARMA